MEKLLYNWLMRKILGNSFIYGKLPKLDGEKELTSALWLWSISGRYPQ